MEQLLYKETYQNNQDLNNRCIQTYHNISIHQILTIWYGFLSADSIMGGPQNIDVSDIRTVLMKSEPPPPVVGTYNLKIRLSNFDSTGSFFWPLVKKLQNVNLLSYDKDKLFYYYRVSQKRVICDFVVFTLFWGEPNDKMLKYQPACN